MAITGVEIAKNKCAPAGVDSILLYNSDLAQGLTLTQLVQQVCIRAAAVGEAQSVLKMNAMTSESQRLSEAADWLKQIVDGTANWTKARDFLVGKMGIPESTLPSTLTINGKPYYNYQMQAAKALQDKMNVLAQTQQEDMIDLQTLVNRRDVAYSTASGVVRSNGQTMSQDAQNFI